MNIAPLFSAQHHPVVVTPRANATAAALDEYVAAHAADLRQLLLDHGGILFRGFGLNSADDFNDTVTRTGARPLQYVGGNSPRTKVTREVYTSTEYPATETISLHNEMSYLHEWPRRLFFYCQLPASGGGQTPLASGRDILHDMPPDIVEKLRTKKINYIRYFRSDVKIGKSWQATYQTEDKAELERIVHAQGSRCTWEANGRLRINTICDAFTVHPDTGAEVWFNQAEQWHPSALHPELRKAFESRSLLAHHCEFGDGEAMDDHTLARIRAAVNSHKLVFDWEKGDLLMLDNILLLHGREPFTGDRKTLAYLSAI